MFFEPSLEREACFIFKLFFAKSKKCLSAIITVTTHPLLMAVVITTTMAIEAIKEKGRRHRLHQIILAREVDIHHLIITILAHLHHRTVPEMMIISNNRTIITLQIIVTIIIGSTIVDLLMKKEVITVI